MLVVGQFEEVRRIRLPFDFDQFLAILQSCHIFLICTRVHRASVLVVGLSEEIRCIRLLLCGGVLPFTILQSCHIFDLL